MTKDSLDDVAVDDTLTFGDSEQSTTRNRADALTHELALRILRGEYRTGDLLPSVRTLAESFSMTSPTVQRAVSVLDGMGLVRATHGRGIEVRDPNTCCSPRLAPLRFEAVAEDPVASAKLLLQHLDLRLDLARLLFSRVDPNEAMRAFALPLARITTADSEVARMEADLELNEVAATVANHWMVGSALRCLEAVVREVPGVATAMYGDGVMYSQSMSGAVRGVAIGGVDGWTRAHTALQAWHAHSAQRYEVALRR